MGWELEVEGWRRGQPNSIFAYEARLPCCGNTMLPRLFDSETNLPVRALFWRRTVYEPVFELRATEAFWSVICGLLG